MYEAANNKYIVDNTGYGYIEHDVKMFETNKATKIPQITINGIKYNGSWYSKFIFDAICAGFVDDEVCKIKANDIVVQTGVGFGSIITIIFITLSISFIILYCYRRSMNRQLEYAISEKIRAQTAVSVSQYQAFGSMQ
jgi:hypothetical protein